VTRPSSPGKQSFSSMDKAGATVATRPLIPCGFYRVRGNWSESYRTVGGNPLSRRRVCRASGTRGTCADELP